MLYNRWLMLLEQPSQGEAFWLMQAFILLEEAKKEELRVVTARQEIALKLLE